MLASWPLQLRARSLHRSQRTPDCKSSQDCQSTRDDGKLRGSRRIRCTPNVLPAVSYGLCVMSGGSARHSAPTLRRHDGRQAGSREPVRDARPLQRRERPLQRRLQRRHRARSTACKDEARCAAKDGLCVATAQDCAKSSARRAPGKCDVSGGACVASSSASCRKCALQARRTRRPRTARVSQPLRRPAVLGLRAGQALPSAGRRVRRQRARRDQRERSRARQGALDDSGRPLSMTSGRALAKSVTRRRFFAGEH